LTDVQKAPERAPFHARLERVAPAQAHRSITRDISRFSTYILIMAARDILKFFLKVPNPQIRTALSGPPPSDEHPLPDSEVWLHEEDDESHSAASSDNVV
jgi:hypothetical protein